MDTLKIQNFKCFKKADFELNKLTILTGDNGSGKSSVIQTLLLIRQIIERTVSSLSQNSCKINLNNYHELKLGSFEDICHEFIEPILGLNDEEFAFKPGEDSLTAEISSKHDLSTIPTYLKNESFFYLNAERIGPRIESNLNNKTIQGCGDLGEWAGNVLLHKSLSPYKVAQNKICNLNKTDNFNIQVDNWMSYIFRSMSVKSIPYTSERCQIRLRGNNLNTTTTNTGFGITYALPIVIDALLAEPDTLLIVENPEAHLHPKAQSNMGFFLGKIASSGVRIIVETHSEHVVNGIRRATLSNFGITPRDVTLYFFQNNELGFKSTKIDLDDKGNLLDFPVDFFDQVRQDMMEILSLANSPIH